MQESCVIQANNAMLELMSDTLGCTCSKHAKILLIRLLRAAHEASSLLHEARTRIRVECR